MCPSERASVGGTWRLITWSESAEETSSFLAHWKGSCTPIAQSQPLLSPKGLVSGDQVQVRKRGHMSFAPILPPLLYPHSCFLQVLPLRWDGLTPLRPIAVSLPGPFRHCTISSRSWELACFSGSQRVSSMLGLYPSSLGLHFPKFHFKGK